ncbi:MAG: hypothetical protein ACI4AD_02820 [Roseburia sp.]
MTRDDRIFLLILLINIVVTVIYFIICGLIWTKEREKRIGYLIKAVVMLLCPVVGPMFFLAGQLIYYLFFKQDVDLEDVIFSKERVKIRNRVDEEQEGNMVPIEEALAVSDKDSLRTLVMNVVRGDVRDSLASIALALNSEDTETSHYAATVLRDELNEFRKQSQKLYLQMQSGGAYATEDACVLIEYMNGILCQNVFLESEQGTYVDMMEEAVNYLFQNDRERLTAEYLEWLCIRLLEIHEFDRMEKWCGCSRELFPYELSTYTCQLKLYFTIQDREKFFRVLKSLKESDVVIDRETLELIRTFS